MSKWPLAKLGNVATVVGGGTPKTGDSENWDGTVPWVTPKDLSTQNSQYIERGVRHITETGLSSCSATLVPAGTVLWSSRAPIGLTAIARNPICTNQGFKNFVPNKDQIDSKYLYHFLRFNAQSLQTYGSGATFKEVSAKRAREITIPLPPLDEQRRIADILDRSKDLHNRTTRHASLASTLTSVIPEPIDPAEVSLSHYVSSVSSGRNISEVDNNISGARVLKVSAVTSKYFRPEESKLLPDSYLPPSQHRVMSGDLIVSRANTKDLVGAAALVQSEVNNMYLPDKLWRLNLKDHVDRHFLWCLLGNPAIRSRVGQRASGSSGSMKNISQKNFLSLPVPNFSRPEQEEIGARVRASLEYTEALEKKSEKLDELYNSLATRAFAGEL